MHKLIIGLTGGIASGKTSVANQLESQGAYLIDTDVIAREVVAVGSEGLAQIKATFGEAVLQADGSLDRKAMRKLIFDDDSNRSKLNAIVHPLISRTAKQRLHNPPAGRLYTVMVIPLLVETDACERYPIRRVLVVDVARETQIARLTQRDHIDAQLANKMIDAQASQTTRLSAADDVINNDGSIDQLSEQVRVVHEKYTQLIDFIE